MATITLKGNPVHTIGELPEIGSTAPDFTLTSGDLEDVTLETYGERKKILNIVPSLDTSTCAASARQFDREVATMGDVVCLTISADLPFASKRFCSDAGITNVVTLSEMRDRSFGRDYGCEIVDGPLAGLLSRAVIVLDGSNVVRYTEQVPEIAQEPDYASALAAVRGLDKPKAVS